MNEALILYELIFCVASIFVLHKFFKLSGLYAFNIIAVIAANIQVLKFTSFSFYSSQVALGSVIFSSTFIVDNIITEEYGPKSARDGVLLSSLAYIIFSIAMYICIFYRNVGDPYMGGCIRAIFSNSYGIIISSIFSYIASKLFDVYCFEGIKKITFGKLKWIRFNVSSLISAFIDQVVFSVLCWKVFLVREFSWSEIFSVYVTFGYCFRAIMIIIVGTIFSRK